MSWKIYLIIITNAINIQINDVPKKIGFGTLKPNKEISIMQAQNNMTGLSIGKLDDKIIIVSPQLIFDILENDNQVLKNNLIKLFPDSEIAILVSAYNVNSYSIIQNGNEIRKKILTDSFKINIGQKLPEEIQCYNRIIKDEFILESAKEASKNGEMNFDDFIDFNVTEETVFELTKRYFSNSINSPEGSNFTTIKMTYYN